MVIKYQIITNGEVEKKNESTLNITYIVIHRGLCELHGTSLSFVSLAFSLNFPLFEAFN